MLLRCCASGLQFEQFGQAGGERLDRTGLLLARVGTLPYEFKQGGVLRSGALQPIDGSRGMAVNPDPVQHEQQQKGDDADRGIGRVTLRPPRGEKGCGGGSGQQGHQFEKQGTHERLSRWRINGFAQAVCDTRPGRTNFA